MTGMIPNTMTPEMAAARLSQLEMFGGSKLTRDVYGDDNGRFRDQHDLLTHVVPWFSEEPITEDWLLTIGRLPAWRSIPVFHVGRLYVWNSGAFWSVRLFSQVFEVTTRGQLLKLHYAIEAISPAEPIGDRY